MTGAGAETRPRSEGEGGAERRAGFRPRPLGVGSLVFRSDRPQGATGTVGNSPQNGKTLGLYSLICPGGNRPAPSARLASSPISLRRLVPTPPSFDPNLRWALRSWGLHQPTSFIQGGLRVTLGTPLPVQSRPLGLPRPRGLFRVHPSLLVGR